MKLPSLLILFILSAPLYSQVLYNKSCTAELKLSLKDQVSDGRSQVTLYSHQAVMTYNPNSGLLKIRLNLATLTENVVSTLQVSEEILFPSDSTLLEIQVAISRDELTKKNDAFDNARKTVPAVIIYKSMQNTVLADYQFGASMLNPSSPLYLNWDFRYEPLPGEEIYVPLFGIHAGQMEFLVLDGLVNWVND